MNRGAHPEWATAKTSAKGIAAYLDDMFGSRLVAYMCNVKDPKAVKRWASGERTPRLNHERRLRAIFTAVLELDTDSADIVRAWFIGMNPELGDESPATRMLYGGERDVLAAARTYARAS